MCGIDTGAGGGDDPVEPEGGLGGGPDGAGAVVPENPPAARRPPGEGAPDGAPAPGRRGAPPCFAGLHLESRLRPALRVECEREHAAWCAPAAGRVPDRAGDASAIALASPSVAVPQSSSADT